MQRRWSLSAVQSRYETLCERESSCWKHGVAVDSGCWNQVFLFEKIIRGGEMPLNILHASFFRGLISYCWYNQQPMQKYHSIAGTTILQTTQEDADNAQFIEGKTNPVVKVVIGVKDVSVQQHHRQSVAIERKSRFKLRVVWVLHL